jgi:hypothetical protein
MLRIGDNGETITMRNSRNVVVEMRAPQRHIASIPSSVWVALVVWIPFFLPGDRRGAPLIIPILWVSGLVGLTLGTILLSQVQLTTARDLATNAVAIVFLLLATYSVTYFTYGTRRDWSTRLSHVDALSVALGTFTTAGTGDIHPRSEFARTLVVSQMAVDILVATVMAAFVFSRLTSSEAELPEA